MSSKDETRRSSPDCVKHPDVIGGDVKCGLGQVPGRADGRKKLASGLLQVVVFRSFGDACLKGAR